MKRFLTLIFLSMLVACGKQGPPQPPVPVRPAPASDLAVAQRGPTVVLTWGYPSLTAAGTTLDRVDRIVVYRFREGLSTELQQTAGEEVDTAAGTEVPRPIELFKRVPEIGPERFRALASPLGELTREQIPSFTTGATVVVEDRPAIRSKRGQPYRYTYGVTTIRGREESDFSNLVSIVPIDVPLPPEEPAVDTEPSQVVLRWDPPKRTILGSAEPVIEGYNVYRLPATGGSVLTSQPLNESPLESTEFRDTPPYGAWRYAVTSVRHSGPPRHESQFPLLNRVEFADRQPPPVPAELSPLVEESVIRLVWSEVEAADLAGYRVYRQAAGEPHEQLTAEPIQRASFVDESPVPGVEYRYGVTSVDTSGNESEPAATGFVLIPK